MTKFNTGAKENAGSMSPSRHNEPDSKQWLTNGETRTAALLACGVVAGPLFIAVSLIQMPLREGFDLTRHALSMLSLGEWGWIQIANFIVAGLLALASAIGMRRALHGERAGTWGSVLIGVAGVCMVAAGIFRTDPSFGFPAGAPAGTPDSWSWHSILHGVSFFTLFVSLTAACFVFVRRFVGLKQKAWSTYSTLSGVAAPALVVLGMTVPGTTGIAFAIAAAVIWGWVALIAAHLVLDISHRRS